MPKATNIEDQNATIAQQLADQNNAFKADYATNSKLKTGVGISNVTETRATSGKFSTKNINKLMGEDNLNLQYEQEHFQQQMDDEQSNFKSGVNAVVGGVLSGLATAVEDLSYIPNLFTQFGNNGETEEWERNSLAESMIEFKKGVADGMPLYTADENGMSFWEGVKGITDSAIGFGLPGGLIGKTVGKGMSILGKGAKAIHQSGKWYTNENIDILLMERHMAKEIRRKSKNRKNSKGPKKRTDEDNQRFEDSFNKLIQIK
jgi:hypothetical protein